jgi:ribosomal protein S6
VERNYESMLIVCPDLSDQELEEIFSKVTGKIESLKGKIIAAKIWERERNFFFLLKSKGAEKKKYYKGCYWLVNFTLDTTKLLDLKEVIKLDERVLRYIVFNREQKAKAAFAASA